MSIQNEVMLQMKTAMKSKDTVALTALRALKAAFLLAKTQTGSKEELTSEQELQIVQKQVKQRKDSIVLFEQQERLDLATSEKEELKVLEQFLPKPLTESEIVVVIDQIINEVGAQGMKDMGKVMGVATAKLVGKADGKVISAIVKSKLS